MNEPSNCVGAIELNDVVLHWVKERIKLSNSKLDVRVHKFWQTISCCHNGQRIESEGKMAGAQVVAKVRSYCIITIIIYILLFITI